MTDFDGLVKIDMKSVCKVVNNFMDKLSNAVGWIATHDTPERLGEGLYIEEIKNSNLPPLEKAALISNAHKILKEYANRRNIIQIAIDNMEVGAKPESVDNDWLGKLMDKARLISSEEFQIIWGHILAQECNSPASIPMSLLYILEQMDKKDAEAFSILCSVSVYVMVDGKKSFFPIVISSELKKYYKKLGLTYDMLVNLQSLGLIEISFFLGDNSYSYTIEDESKIIIKYFDESFELPNEIKSFNCGNVIFSKSGEALCGVINADKIDGFFSEQCIPIWKRQTEEK